MIMNIQRLHVIDSMSLSTGIGLQVLFAAQLAAEGMSALEIVAKVEQRRSKIRASFVVETLTYLAEAGAPSRYGAFGKYSEAQAPDRCGARCYECLQEIPWQTILCDFKIC